ncbi:Thiol-disulfide isomerase or thioredoxin [Chitinophaga jiangningensis]|uniref:Thiol-disulfide isomerase or thioredoxin n=1 Tax=Chitinophaga jiangningensis TaxID=1419482 RepID=A0A1M6ZTD1_9BACT|nr:TlpA disulfide reductase family protein [Chitinophaga jiangningensis]SHL33670.1 Thiol-disulfide isomerase or thioredoxin [Chitinophaga jiangningensis]
MKKVVLKMWMPLALIAVPSALLAQQTKVVKSITVKGTVEFIDPKQPENKVWLMKESLYGKGEVIDSAIVGADKSFKFQLKQDHQGAYTIDAMHWDRATFWSDADVQVAMRGYDTARYKVKVPHYNFVEGSSDNNFINQYILNSENNYRRSIDDYNMEYYAKKSTDTNFISYLNNRKVYSPIGQDYAQRQELLMRVYKGRPVTIYAIRGMAGTEAGEKYDKAMKLLDDLVAKYPWLTEAKALKENIIYNTNQAKKLKNGQPMPSINYPTPDGKLAGLDQYKGKYLLVDFWASWCGPCRQAIPKVKELYTSYKDRGFEVASISIDTNDKAWRKAMEEENMPWLQLLSDNKDTTMKVFQFSGIPTMYLVDPNGNIVERFTGFTEDAQAVVKNILEKGAKPAAKKAASIPMTSF